MSYGDRESTARRPSNTSTLLLMCEPHEDRCPQTFSSPLGMSAHQPLVILRFSCQFYGATMSLASSGRSGDVVFMPHYADVDLFPPNSIHPYGNPVREFECLRLHSWLLRVPCMRSWLPRHTGCLQCSSKANMSHPSSTTTTFREPNVLYPRLRRTGGMHLILAHRRG